MIHVVVEMKKEETISIPGNIFTYLRGNKSSNSGSGNINFVPKRFKLFRSIYEEYDDNIICLRNQKLPKNAGRRRGWLKNIPAVKTQT